MDSSLWYRTFTRGAKPGEPDQPLDDIDTVANNDFIQSHFTDTFGRWLTQENNRLLGTLDGLLSVFFNSSNFKLQTYLVGDGTSISKKPKEKRPPWFEPHLRFVCVVTPRSPKVKKLVQNFTQVPWLFFVVGSHLLKDEDRFLQVASWDGTTFRFYQRDTIIGQNHVKGWIYQGQSSDAFSDADQYLGPFNGHVNGACIMKEIHQPWIHWYSPTDDLADCLTEADRTAFKNSPYLTCHDSPNVFGGATVVTADSLESLILSGVQAWFKQRQKNDFLDKKEQLLTQPYNIQRWVAHLLLTTTINIAGASNQGSVVPPDHFLDNELLILESTFDLADNIEVPNFAFDGEMYKTACTELGLCLMQELDPDNLPPSGTIWLPMNTLGEGKVPKEDKIPFMIARDGEGKFPFTILQSSIEDRYGVATMQNLKAGKISLRLFSESTANALLMVDFWNPIYSWRRGRLMQYIPTTTTLTGNTYDLEANFIAAVKASDAFKDQSSPEYAFVQLLNVSTDVSQARIQAYLNNVSQKLQKYKGLRDYMKLAESRRRIYRPLPLDEFGFTLPYARNLDPSTPWYEMTEKGCIQAIPPEGVAFLSAWIGNLAGFDPQLLIDASSKERSIVHPALLPKPANLPLLCQSARSANGRAKSQGCPYLAKRKRSSVKSVPAVATLAQISSSAMIRKLGNADIPTWSAVATLAQISSSAMIRKLGNADIPTWSDDILPLFKSPYWAKASDTGDYWRDNMIKYGYGPLDLQNPAHVQRDIVTIYDHLRSRSMPIVRSDDEFWPEDALEMLRAWANGGFRLTPSDPVIPQNIIPKPIDPPATIRVRKDILSLTNVDLQTYRASLDDILCVDVLKSKWQELGLLHAQWCLHYQEGFVLWHRAMLRYVEELIGFPIPYWNCFAADSANPDSPTAGIPAAFLDETYEHPSKGTRPNPLKYALTLDGFNPDTKQKYVTRDPVLVAGPKSPNWTSKIARFAKYHEQLATALSQDLFSHPELADGDAIPWANIAKFFDHMPNHLYAYRKTFDGLLEQAHDNFHGWIGGLSKPTGTAGDMSDNTYTAFDPIFLSYHANIDRVAASFMRAHPEQQYSSNFPLQPFVDNAKNLNYSDPRPWMYTTIGDMAKDTMALGYLYAPPSSPDYMPLFTPPKRSHVPKGGNALRTISKADTKADQATSFTSSKKEPWIVFSNVACTKDSYVIDIFVADTASTAPNHITNPDYIGRMTRLGMGSGPADGGLRNKQRCHKPAVTRAMPAKEFASRLEKCGWEVKTVVTRMKTGKILTEEEVTNLGGFEGKVMWCL